MLRVVAVAGVYEARPESCYRFAQETYSVDTAAPAPLDLQAREYQVSGTLEASSSSAAASAQTLPVKLTRPNGAETELQAKFETTAFKQKGEKRDGT